jgi:hypothetical protein
MRPAQVGRIGIMDRMRHLHRFAGVLVLAQAHFEIENRPALEFLPAFLADMHHHAIHGHTHTPIRLDCSAGRLPLLRHRIGLSPLGLLQRLELGTPRLGAPPDARAGDVHLADLLQNRLGLFERH